MSDDKLERAIHEIQSEAADPAVVERAAQRVWANLSAAEAAPIRGCAGFQTLLPDYRAGKLPEARALLVKDHLHECVACRQAFDTACGKVVTMPEPKKRVVWPAYFRWAIAAALALTVGLGTLAVWNQAGGNRGRMTVTALEGALFRVAGAELQVVKAGEELAPGIELRTGRGSRAALRLGDGSTVEMSERASVSVDATRRDTTVRLGLGQIIVQAAKRRSGHLYVAARDCRVAVTGTVFSVNSGLKGSRVSVIEGEVRVSQPGSESVLRAGDQIATSTNMSPVAMKEEIAWSRDAAKHMAVLQELSAVQRKIAEIPLPGVRYSSRLLPLLPANTAVYGAIPNLGSFLGEAHQIFRQRVQESAVLREWWDQKMEGKNGPKPEEVIAKIRAVADFLGDELVLAAIRDEKGKVSSPIFLAEVKKPGLRELLEKDLHAPSDLKIVIEEDLAAFSPDTNVLHAVAARTGGFEPTPFGQSIAAAYRAGVGMLFSADLESITQTASKERETPPGISELKYLMVEQKETSGRTETRAALSFDGARAGVATWLAPPAPIRALDFVSPEASLAVAATMKNPAAVVDEVFAWLEKSDPQFRQKLAEGEAKLGFQVRDDLAASLGSEFAFAVDGAVLPPAWKLAVEVYDTARLKWTLDKLVEAANREGAKKNHQPATTSQETLGGRTYYSIKLPDGKKIGEVHYTFVDGYLLAAASRGLLDLAIQNRVTGYTLTRSAGFTALVPRDHHSNFSAIAYHNLASVAGAVGEWLSPEQQQAAKRFAAELKPTLVAAYGERDRITLASTGSIFSLTGNRLGLAQFLGVQKRGTRAAKPAYR